jgi:adenylyltransferase/sulfurtransferase
MKEITSEELKQWYDENRDFQLIDVREEHEYETGNLNGKWIPLGEILNRHNEIDKDKPVVIHCRSGARSATAINLLEKQFNYTNLINLQGGILAYSRNIDPSIHVI